MRPLSMLRPVFTITCSNHRLLCIASGTFQNGTKQSAKCTGQNGFFSVLSPNNAKPRTQEAQQPNEQLHEYPSKEIPLL